MASEKQIKANRENAKKSTGPKTPEGKARSSMNALKHGLTSERTILPWEDRVEWEDMLLGINESFKPQGKMEGLLTERIASSYWRIRRALEIELQLLTERGGTLAEVANLSRYETSIDRCALRNLKMLEHLQQKRLKTGVAGCKTCPFENQSMEQTGEATKSKVTPSESDSVPDPMNLESKGDKIDIDPLHATMPPMPRKVIEALNERRRQAEAKEPFRRPAAMQAGSAEGPENFQL